MKVSKQVTINLGNYQSLRVGVEEAPTFSDADSVIIRELHRLKIPVDQRIKQCLLWEKSEVRNETQ